MVKNGDDGVCRDFLRNVCKRGNRCKFRHPDQGEVKKELQFCHDYQNKMCMRSNCKFIHCTKEDEEYYHQTGDLPPGVEESAARNAVQDGANGEIPVCRDYLKGECSRASACKYRHMSRGDVEHEQRNRRRSRPPGPPPPDRYADEYEHERYRRWLEHSRYEDFDRMDRDRYFRERDPREMPFRSRGGTDARELEEENVMLRRKNEELRKTVADLTSTNDVLLEQNARLRALRAEATSAVLQAETHLVNSTATAGPQLSQGRSLGSSTHHTVAATAPLMYPARVAQVPLVAENTIPAPGAAQGTQLLAAPMQPAVLAASMAQAHVVPMSVGVTASMVTYPIVSQALRNSALS
ncbi:zinc finger CCCH domain-containing protein 10-like isoform X1 [Lytechinus variegatus]|uniref:zinc finger CCCH domain-containing protein 10-like isoform X1 n=1 Tax=Lytechinus variegatus TaxID=7654 RepID=UPI001BB1B08B|nr:zinc finger CCCH domain-containing protein 10-like isoform X1 [Lytechinus variegatus]XP_041478511.1 zinc finger CCCH domain-containing protein 10-like isoform X1 [Lytechinus variegatus]